MVLQIGAILLEPEKIEDLKKRAIRILVVNSGRTICKILLKVLVTFTLPRARIIGYSEKNYR